MKQMNSFKGDPVSYEYIVDLYNKKYSRMVYFMKKKTGNPDDAKDIVMDVFRGLLRNRPRLPTPEAANKYITISLENSFVNLKRKQNKARELDKELAIRFADQHERNLAIKHETEQNYQIFQMAMGLLKEEERQFMEMHLYTGSEMKEIASHFKINLQSAYNKKSHIVKKLIKFVDILRNLHLLLLFLMLLSV